MNKGLGIAAFVILMLSFPIPLVGPYINFLALIIATGAAWGGDKVWPVVTSVVSAVHLFLLSPTWHVAMFASAYMRGMTNAAATSPFPDGTAQAVMNNSTNAMSHTNNDNVLMTVGFIAAPIVVLVWKSMTAQRAPAR